MLLSLEPHTAKRAAKPQGRQTAEGYSGSSEREHKMGSTSFTTTRPQPPVVWLRNHQVSGSEMRTDAFVIFLKVPEECKGDELQRSQFGGLLKDANPLR